MSKGNLWKEVAGDAVVLMGGVRQSVKERFYARSSFATLTPTNPVFCIVSFRLSAKICVDKGRQAHGKRLIQAMFGRVSSTTTQAVTKMKSVKVVFTKEGKTKNTESVFFFKQKRSLHFQANNKLIDPIITYSNLHTHTSANTTLLSIFFFVVYQPCTATIPVI